MTQKDCRIAIRGIIAEYDDDEKIINALTDFFLNHIHNKENEIENLMVRLNGGTTTGDVDNIYSVVTTTHTGKTTQNTNPDICC